MERNANQEQEATLRGRFTELAKLEATGIEREDVDIHHHVSVMELGHLLTRSGLTYPEVSSQVCHDSFCQLGNGVSLPG